MRIAVILALVGLGVQSAMSQPAPFDMTPERTFETPIGPPAPKKVDPKAPDDAEQVGAESSTGPLSQRFIVPFEKLVLSGETAERSWMVFLTTEQATATSTLHLGYRNSIYVAPEVSRLRLTINGKAIVDQPIGSAEKVVDIVAQVPNGTLQAGTNVIRIEAQQRHRTDCTIQSTYELWTEIDPSRTFIAFANATNRLSKLEDIPAVGVNPTGQTSFSIVVPSFGQSTATPLIRLSEGLAILAGTPHQSFEITRESGPQSAPGLLTVVVGTATELSGIFASLPDGASTAPVVTFVDDQRFGPSTLVITGPTWEAVAEAVETIVAPTDRVASAPRTVLETRFWRAPDAPFLSEGGRLTLAELGVATQEFSGRLFRKDFAVGIPSDFFAAAYGDATILLDAAYSSAVLPGSHIDVYVNGNIAATVPITTAGGGILRHLPISVTMRHFRPGANLIAIEAVLLTQEDAVCAPGATADNKARFALFDTSQFVMPRFARIGQRPNLEALTGNGFPYNRIDKAVPLFVGGGDLDSMSAAATLMAKISMAAGRPIPVETIANPASIGEGDALFFGPVAQLPTGVLAQLGIVESNLASWGALPTAQGGASAQEDTNATFDRWRDQLAGRGWRGQISALEDWLTRNFEISFASLRFSFGTGKDFEPSAQTTLLVAQGQSFGNQGTWTVATSPDERKLLNGVRAIVTPSAWSQIGGRITTYEQDSSHIGTIPAGNIRFFRTQPASFENFRLIASNWLSANILSYSAFLFAFCMMLGIATAALLATFGRPK